MVEVDDEKKAEQKSKWVYSDDGTRNDVGSIAFLTLEEDVEIEQRFVSAAFLYRKDIHGAETVDKTASTRYIQGIDSDIWASSGGRRINTCDNCVWVLSAGQFHAYCQTFNQAQSIKSVKNCTITEMCRLSLTIEVAGIRVPFERLSIVNDVIFIRLGQNICTFL